ncbi:MAG: hypothetical protein A2651_01290 [Candidatus Yanofskybacteria bacterium RIFCSPHIGHO2_01_FULL_42_12]|uniref:Glycosyltransferase RgtA/B/C/D-like domain-containing protein n=1 Tax=Candidatus Yanofskybacteria bacterium RIFCSPLOWO2_01_FULL_42_49 TaxID=1802694 RepID=A0A1F8GCC5_9BACT|nr:MAG: hypothetical protein A2651_01290 [Candidatus Yanofskybacteria bacterium RIFCSPHIGHO2_01_FULL_42_12]OGN22109.1 MAG: hypothetical protein A2918_03030 [Candidatus Yanofskybacteria bacterium RIFCSPLOWO2_01_FULL_42_49]
MFSVESKVIIFVVVLTAAYFIAATPVMMDDGFHYEGFAESLSRGKLDFKSFYGFQGLSFFAVPVFWLTGSHNSIIIASMIFSLLSVPLAYLVGRDFYDSRRAGYYFLILFLLTPYPYTTMMRGFQEAALLFFILLIIYTAINKKAWTPIVWGVGGIVKPFALTLLPLFVKDFWPQFKLTKLRLLSINVTRFGALKLMWVVIALAIGGAYLGASFYQTGHLVNNAAINSYEGNFDAGNPPPLIESFVPGIKGFLRVGANLLLHFRKIMISPIVIMLGACALWFNKSLRLRKESIAAIILNFLLVGSLTFSFSKYLLPMTTLFALASVSYLLKYRWLMWLVLVDSFFVFLPIWNYFGQEFWSNIFIYLLPFWATIVLSLFSNKKRLN